MDKLHRSLRQLRSLARLRDMQKTQSAAHLADMNQGLKKAEENLELAQARYQLALEVQRRKRANGQVIDPILYAHQLDSAAMVRHALTERAEQRNDAKADQQQAMTTFATHHAQHKVVQTAADDTRSQIVEQRLAFEAIEIQDQSGRTRFIKDNP